jgi:hypothetical protein
MTLPPMDRKHGKALLRKRLVRTYGVGSLTIYIATSEGRGVDLFNSAASKANA